MDNYSLLSITIFLICGILGAVMSEKRDRNKIGGFCLGFFLGIIGIAIIAIVGKKKPKEVSIE